MIIGQDIGDNSAEFDRAFLQELRDLRVFVNDKDTVDEHKRSVNNEMDLKLKNGSPYKLFRM